MDRKDLKEKMIVIGIMTAVFLPVRFVFFAYISKYWFGSVGMVSVIAFVMHILATKNKLGKFGRMYQNQTVKTTKGRLGRGLLALSIFLIVLFGTTSYLIEKANTTYFEEKEVYTKIFKLIFNNMTTGKSQKFDENIDYEKFTNRNLTTFQEFERSFSLVAGVANDITGGWILHFYTVGFVGQLEFLGILLFYRFVHRKKN